MPRASHSYGSPTIAVQQYPSRRSSLKTVHRTVFLTLRPSRVQVLIEKESRTSATLSFWQGQKDLVSPAGSVGASALRAEVSTGDPHPSTRSACRVFKLFNPSQNKKTPAGVFLFWQGQKDLNPRHAVLETAALPTELYPYIKFFLAEITLILYIYCIILSTIIISKCFYEASF